ncbi:MAG TPA: DUF192 domain-containing protein [Herpetosiphonaceae bacterium]|nr:DUF192 domain-containing protein [Herpetosiphonaceae bacterium]
MSLHRIANQTRGSVLATQAELADSFLKRGLGLMGRRSLPEGGGLILYPNNNIHMFFMRFPIDVLFVDRDHRVVGLRHTFKPWRPFAAARAARYTIELPAGVLAASGTEVGDTLQLTPDLH